MTVGLAVVAAASLAPYFVADLTVLLVSIVVQGIGSSMFTTAILVAIAALSTPGTRVRDMSTYQAAQVVGTGIGPALAGLGVALWGYPAPFLFQTILALCALVAVQTVRPTAPAAVPVREIVENKSGRGRTALAIAGLSLMVFAVLSTRVASA